MAQGLSSLLGGLAQGFTDLGKSTLDVLGGGATNNVLTAGLDALINKKSYGQAVKDANQRQKDFRKWLYETESDKDAAAKGLGTALNGAQTAIDLIPGLGQSAPVNAIQGAIGGLADEFKFNGENYDWGKGAQRAAVGAGAGLAAGGLGKALANSGSKVLSNGVLKGAATGSLGGALSQAGGTAIEGGNADQILQSAAQGAQFGALLGAGTGGIQSLAGALKKTRANNNAPAIMDEEMVMAELAPEQGYKRLYRGLTQEYDPNYPTNKLDTSGYESWTDNPELAKQYGKNVYYIDVPETDIKTSYLDENPMSETYGDRNPIYSIDKKAGLNGVSGKEYLLYMDDPYQKNLKYNRLAEEAPKIEEQVMASRVPDGQLGLFDQTATKTPETGYSQLGLFDQPTQPVTPKTIDAADVNPYAPVNGQVTQTMLDRAAETLKNYKKGTPDNDLYNRINPETLPSGYKELRELLDNSGDFIKQRIGAEDIKKASPEKIAAYLYPEGTTDYDTILSNLNFAKSSKTKFGKAVSKNIVDLVKARIAKDAREQLGEQAALSPEIRRNLSLHSLDNISFRDGYTAAADNAISERLGIAPGNTLKYNGPKDTGRGVLGRYKIKSRNIATVKSSDPEEALSNVAHERLHSFQNEAEKFAAADSRKDSGYNKEVIDAYNELSDSLKDSQLGWAQMREIGQKLGRRDANLPYYADATEQEARMLQQYLHDKGYTNAIDTALGEKMGRPKEFNTDYYPAFDKFFDKLRDLSKKGVALPAILAALGLGEYATENQEEDKDNGQQI